MMHIRRGVAAITVFLFGGLGADASDSLRAARRTMSDILVVAITVEAFATDHNRYPAAHDIDELRKEVEPVYVRALPQTDAWGTEFLYVVSEDSERY